VNLDFGSSFPGFSRFLEIRVRQSGGGAYTTLSPRQPLTSTPYSIKSLASDTSVNFSGNLAGDVTGPQGASTVTRIQSRDVAAQSPIDGQVLKYNAAASQWAPATDNSGVGGVGTPNNVPLWTGSTTLGNSAITQSAQGRIGIGTAAPSAKLDVVGNESIAILASSSSAPGSRAVSGVTSSGYGVVGNSTGTGIGVFAGSSQPSSLALRVEGSSWFKGDTTPLNSANTGSGAGIAVGSTTTYGYLQGYDYSASLARTLVFNKDGGSVGIGTTSPIARLDVVGDSNSAIRGLSTANGTVGVTGDSSGGTGVFGFGTTGVIASGTKIGLHANGAGSGNVAVRAEGTSWFKGDTTPLNVENTGSGTGVVIGSSGNLGYISSFDYSAFQPRTLVLNNTGGNVGIGTNAPTEKLTVRTGSGNYGLVHTDGNITVGSYIGGSTGGGWFGTKSGHPLSLFANNGTASITIDTAGLVYFPVLASAGGAPLCRNGPALAFCSSSLRYKKNISDYSPGMSFVKKLRPISFDWKGDGSKDVGFGAEDIAKIDPRFVTYNYTGEIEGVKYDRLSVAFVNALKEQESKIEELQKTNAMLLARLLQIEKRIKAQGHGKRSILKKSRK
jgi:hypothetical protein